MKTMTYIINWLIVFLCFYASGSVVRPLCNIVFALQRRPGGYDYTLVHIDGEPWIPLGILLFWGIATVFFRVKDSVERRQFHTSASIFLGLLVFFLEVIRNVAHFYKDPMTPNF